MAKDDACFQSFHRQLQLPFISGVEKEERDNGRARKWRGASTRRDFDSSKKGALRRPCCTGRKEGRKEGRKAARVTLFPFGKKGNVSGGGRGKMRHAEIQNEEHLAKVVCYSISDFRRL